MAKNIHMQSGLFEFHDFEKVNLVSDKNGYDTYRCKCCGLEGVRKGLVEELTLKRPYAKKLHVCDGRKQAYSKENVRNSFESKKVEVVNAAQLDQFGFSLGQVFETVPCPKGENHELEGVWVPCEKRNEPVRLLVHEYKEL